MESHYMTSLRKMRLSNGLRSVRMHSRTWNMLSQTPPVVTFPDFTFPCSLYTDASCSAIGTVLSERQGHRDKIVAYASHVLTKAKNKWSTCNRELWAILWAVWHFRHYLCEQPIVNVTDHNPLLGLTKIPIDIDRTGHRAQWSFWMDCDSQTWPPSWENAAEKALWQEYHRLTFTRKVFSPSSAPSSFCPSCLKRHCPAFSAWKSSN